MYTNITLKLTYFLVYKTHNFFKILVKTLGIISYKYILNILFYVKILFFLLLIILHDCTVSDYFKVFT